MFTTMPNDAQFIDIMAKVLGVDRVELSLAQEFYLVDVINELLQAAL